VLRLAAYRRRNPRLELLDGFDRAVASFLNSFSNVLDVLLDLVNPRMHFPDQIVLALRKLFDAPCHCA